MCDTNYTENHINLLVTNKEVGLEVNTDKTQYYMFKSY